MSADKILEVAILNIRTGQEAAFESAFKKASEIISASEGYIVHELRPCLEKSNQYLLLVQWEKLGWSLALLAARPCNLEDHTIGFRRSEGYKQWKEMLHHFYDPFPVVEHYGESLIDGSRSV